MRTERERLSIGVKASIAACLVGIAVAIVGGRVAREQAANRVRAAAERIAAVGGKVDDDPNVSYSATVGNTTRSWNSERPPRVYHFLWWSFDEELEDEVSLDLSGCRLTLDDCKTIAATRNCAILNLRNASLPSDGLAYLMAMPISGVVDLRGVAFSADALQGFERHDPDYNLIVSARSIGPEVLAELKRKLRKGVYVE